MSEDKPQSDELTDLFNKTEDLNPDLVHWIEDSSFGKNLKHPLVFSLFYHPQMNALLNKTYEHKKEATEKALENKEYAHYIWLHERPYRMQKLYYLAEEIPDEEYWEILGSVWTDSENLWQYDHLLDHLLTLPKKGKEKMMDEREHKLLSELPDEFIIYRGHQSKNRLGYSWTLSCHTAKWFSQRFYNKKIKVVSGIVSKKDVIALLLGRNEFEIVCHPKNIKKIKTIKNEERPDWAEKIANKAAKQFRLNKLSYHGIWHWEKVEANALALARKTKGCDETVARAFALIHDSQRENEVEDNEHGKRAALYAEELHKKGELPLSAEQLKVLMEACEFHEDGKVSDNPTIGVCWDADRLDLTRVGIIPDKNLLSTPAGKKLLWKI